MATDRPIIKIEFTTSDKIAEVVAWMLLITFWALVFISYQKLPSIIPTHYDISGQVDDRGSKSTIFLIPVIATGLFALLTIINRYPHVFNYPTPVTPENAKLQYTIATRLMRYMKISLLLTFFVMGIATMQPPGGDDTGVAAWILPASGLLIFIPMAIFLPKLLNVKNNNNA